MPAPEDPITTFYASIVGEVIRQEREKQEILQAAMAERIGVSPGNYSRYESGSVDLPVSALLQISVALLTPAHVLLKRAADMVQQFEAAGVCVSATRKDGPPYLTARTIMGIWPGALGEGA